MQVTKTAVEITEFSVRMLFSAYKCAVVTHGAKHANTAAGGPDIKMPTTGSKQEAIWLYILCSGDHNDSLETRIRCSKMALSLILSCGVCQTSAQGLPGP